MQQPLNQEEQQIIRAALRPEFQHHNFNPADYELVDGYPQRKDRFQSVCQNLASALYGSRAKWSTHALRRHLSELLGWWNGFDEVEQVAPGQEMFEFRGKEYPLQCENWLEHTMFNEGLISVNKADSNEQPLMIDVFLSDGSVLSRCECSPFRVALSDGSPKTWRVMSQPVIKWRGVDVTSNVVAYRFLMSQQLLNKPFWRRFVQDNLNADLASQLAHEQKLREAEVESIDFRVTQDLEKKE